MARKVNLETVGHLAVVASLLFVGFQIRQSTVQAGASAFQAIGVATSEWHQNLDDRVIRLYTEAQYPDALVRWSLADWDAYYRSQLSAFRIIETLHLQVDQGLLTSDAVDQLGYRVSGNVELVTAGFQCIWPDLSRFVGSSLRETIETTLAADQFECPVDIGALRDETVLGTSPG